MSSMKSLLEEILAKNDYNIEDIKNFRHIKVRNYPLDELHIRYLGKLCGHDYFSFEVYFKEDGDPNSFNSMSFIDYNGKFLVESYKLKALDISYKGIEIDTNGQISFNMGIYEQLERSADQWEELLREQYLQGTVILNHKSLPLYIRLLQVIKLLGEKSRSYEEFTRIFHSSQQTIYNYLKELREFGIVCITKKGKRGSPTVWQLSSDWLTGLRELLVVYSISNETLRQFDLNILNEG